MSSKDDPLQNAHNKGESDRSSGAGYNAPHSVTKGVVDSLVGTKSEREQHVAENKAYNQGWKNTDKQSK